MGSKNSTEKGEKGYRTKGGISKQQEKDKEALTEFEEIVESDDGSIAEHEKAALKVEDISLSSQPSSISGEDFAESQQQILQFLSGNMTSVTFETVQHLLPKRKLRIFVSSTFTDTYRERKLLHEVILPELQKLAGQAGIQLIVFDMRYGIKDDSTLDHSTWEICQQAISQCQSESDNLFFLSLQGQKYGYRPLPKYIDRQAFESILESCDDPSLPDFAKSWYQLDDNSQPPRYELRSLSKLNQEIFWNQVLPTLRDKVFPLLVFDSSLPSLLVGKSITEWETLFSMHFQNSSNRSIWIQKELSFDSANDNENYYDFDDCVNDPLIQACRNNLCSTMSTHMELLDPVPGTKLTVRDYMENNSACQAYFQSWINLVQTRLKKDLEDCSLRSQRLSSNIRNHFGLPVEYFQEMVHHYQITFEKAAHFIGREHLVAEALATLTSSSSQARKGLNYDQITCGIIGQSGSGKTALMSKIATELYSLFPTIPIIIRYCGTSRFSLHGLDLVQSIILQVLCVYQQKQKIIELLPKITSQSYKEALLDFSKVMKQYPVILVIDSVDQLSNRDEARSKLSFLKELEVHDQSRVLISTLPDEYFPGTTMWKYRYLCEKVLRDHQIPIVEMRQYTVNESNIREILECFLSRRQRSLTPTQWHAAINAAAQEPTMLYLNLSLEVITHWRSWHQDITLKPTVRGLIHQIFEQFEKQYGKAFVSYAFGLITFSRNGISDLEMIACLTNQLEVFQEVCQYWHDVQTIPLHVWLRLKLVIKPLIAEKESACVKWYHRQLWEAAQERYQAIKMPCHRLLGNYFRQQPLTLNGLSIWQTNSIVNIRRVKETYYHWIELELVVEAVEEICSLERICASALVGDCFTLLSSLLKLIPVVNGSNLMFYNYCHWLRREINSIVTNPRIFVPLTASAEPSIALVHQHCQQLKYSFSPSEFQNHGRSMIWPETINGATQYNNLVANVKGHTSLITCVSWNRQGDMIASAADDKTIKIWDAATGEAILTLEGHEDTVRAISWDPTGKKLVSGSCDLTLKIWDVTTGDLLHTLEGHGSFVTGVAWSHNGEMIASGSQDKLVRVWDVSTASNSFSFEKHHKDYLTAVAWNSMDTFIASSAADRTVKIWSLETRQLVLSLEGHALRVAAISWHPTKNLLASGSEDNTIKIWDTFEGTVLQTLSGHTGSLAAVAWSYSGDYLASSAEDNTVKIWKVSEGMAIDSFSGHRSRVSCVSWSPDDSKICSGSWDNVVKIWIVNKEMTESLQHRGSVATIAFSYHGDRLATGSFDETIKIWDAMSLQHVLTLRGHTNTVRQVAWSYDDTKLASCSIDRTIKIWNTNNGQLLFTLTGHEAWVISLAWRHDCSELVSGSEDKVMKIWNTVTGSLISTIPKEEGDSAVAWSKDGAYLAIGLAIRDVKKRKIVKRLTASQQIYISALQWCPDGRRIAAGCGAWGFYLEEVESESVMSATKDGSDCACLEW